MAAPPSAYKDRQFLAVIGDEVSECVALSPPKLAKQSYRTLLLDCYLQELVYEMPCPRLTCTWSWWRAIACYGASRFAKKLPSCRQQDGQCGHRRGIREIHKWEEGYWNSVDQSTCTEFICGLVVSATDANVDCWTNSSPSRSIYSRFPSPPRNSQQGPPIWSREG